MKRNEKEDKKREGVFTPLIRGGQDILRIKLEPEDETRLENENLRIIAVVSFPLGFLETILLFGTLVISQGSISGYAMSLVSLASCAAICFLSCLLTRKWIRKEADRKKIRLLTTFLYWVFCAWGILGSVRHYMNGSQMIIFDTVQIGFALFLYVYPIRAAFRVVTAYSVQFFILWRIDHAQGIQVVNYYVLALVVLSGYVIRYLQKIRSIQQKSTIIEKNEDLVFDSTHDALTGMKNRLALRKDFSNYIGKNLYVVMADVDRFKQYNDWYGHEVGDRVLAGIGKLTLELFGYDSVYRYGGDEFLIILERGMFENVSELLLVWEQEVSSLEIEGLDVSQPLHCSYGVVRGKTESKDDVRRMLLEADNRMYKMKQSLTRRQNT